MEFEILLQKIDEEEEKERSRIRALMMKKQVNLLRIVKVEKGYDTDMTNLSETPWLQV